MIDTSTEAARTLCDSLEYYQCIGGCGTMPLCICAATADTRDMLAAIAAERDALRDAVRNMLAERPGAMSPAAVAARAALGDAP